MTYVVSMSLSHGACCATGEMRNFLVHGKKDLPAKGVSVPSYQSHTKAARDLFYDDTRMTGRDQNNYAFLGKGETKEQAWANCLTILKDSVAQEYSYEGHQIRYFWFADYDKDGNFDADELRKVLQNEEGVIHLGSWTNGNTDHIVDGYILPIATEGKQEDDYDD